MKCHFPDSEEISHRHVLVQIPVQIVDIRDDGLYEITCQNGHTTITALQEQKFEVLFDIGAHAIFDGYYREAVSSFKSSLERFYEFYIKVISRIHNVSPEEYDLFWKMVANQSERQIGAFVCLYLFENKKSPTVLKDKWHKFRNEVIHKGKIPEINQALEYGEVVLQLIEPVLQDLKTHHSQYVQEIVKEHIQSIQLVNPNKIPLAVMTSSTIISIARSKSASDPITLVDYLKDIERRRKHHPLSETV